MTEINFADRLVAAIEDKQTPLVVGLDPRFERLPFFDAAAPHSNSDKAAAYTKFCIELITVIADKVPAVKPQSAFFEALGPAGMVALFNVVQYASSKGLIVVMDAKRGDIGSTAAAYAHAYLDRSDQGAWKCDALTVNPYLGGDSLTPFVETATAHGSGIFILAKTSNPGSKTFQELPTPDRPLYEAVAEQIQSLAASTLGQHQYGAVGAVIGATHPEQLTQLRSTMPNSFFLVPGLGAQGGTAADIAGAFDQRGHGAIINSSRAIIFAHENPKYESASSWEKAVEQATIDTIDAIASETNAGNLQKPATEQIGLPKPN